MNSTAQYDEHIGPGHGAAPRSSRVACYFFLLIALSSLMDSFTLSFWEILRLSVISMGLSYLVWRQSRAESNFQIGILLLWIIFAFILTQFPGRELGNEELYCARTALLGASFMVLRMDKGGGGRCAKLSAAILGIAACVGVGIMFRPLTGNAIVHDVLENWKEAWILPQVVLAYMVMARILCVDRTGILKKRLLVTTFLVFALISGAGISQVIYAAIRFDQAIDDFRDAKFERSRRNLLETSALVSRLRLESLSTESFVQSMSAEVNENRWNARAHYTIGEIAEDAVSHQIAYRDDSELALILDNSAEQKKWSQIYKVFQEIYKRDPEYPAIHAKLGWASLKLWGPGKGVEILREGIKQNEVEVEDFLSLAAVLCKSGRWEEANEALDLAIAKSGLGGKIDFASVSGGKVLRIELGTFLPREFLQFLDKFSEYEIVRLLQKRGWEVLYRPMVIGDTHVTAPVDIEVWGEQQYDPRREAIFIDGKQVSPRGRGRNVVVLDSETGDIDTIASLGISMLPGLKETSIAEFLKTIPKGKIVAATILDTGGGGLNEEDINELKKLGTMGYPGNYCAQAFIGVKGAGFGTAFELRGNPVVGGGVLAGNVNADLVDDSRRLESVLREAVVRSGAKIAIYIPGLGEDAEILVFSL